MLKQETKGIKKKNGKSIHLIRYVDDIIVIANSEMKRIKMLLSLTKKFQKFKVKINSKKTKILLV